MLSVQVKSINTEQIPFLNCCTEIFSFHKTFFELKTRGGMKLHLQSQHEQKRKTSGKEQHSC